MPRGFFKCAGLTLALAAAGPHAARADATTEAQLRAALQSATAQIATLEDQVANLQASEAPNVAMIEALRAQLQTLQAGKTTAAPASAAGKAKTGAAMAALNRQLAARQAALNRSQTAYATAAGAASAAAAQNAALKTQLAGLNTGLASCDMKNAKLYQTAKQILDAYAHKDDLFGAIADREPFIGFKRVQLQNIVQNQQDRLDDNQIAPASSTP